MSSYISDMERSARCVIHLVITICATFVTKEKAQQRLLLFIVSRFLHLDIWSCITKHLFVFRNMKLRHEIVPQNFPPLWLGFEKKSLNRLVLTLDAQEYIKMILRVSSFIWNMFEQDCKQKFVNNETATVGELFWWVVIILGHFNISHFPFIFETWGENYHLY